MSQNDINEKLGEVTQFLSFDTETTGVNVWKDRIVTASFVLCDVEDGLNTVGANYLINPGIPIPAGAMAIHGITDEEAQKGLDPAATIPLIRDVIYEAWSDGIPVVVYNATYDFSLLSAELVRYGEEPFKVTGPVLDPMVLFRHLGYSKASLAYTTKEFGITNDKAHDSESDATASVKVLLEIIKKSPELANMRMRDLYVLQRQGHRNWADKTGKNFARRNAKFDTTGHWPMEELKK